MPFESTAIYRPVLALWSQHETELRRWLASRAPIKAEVDDLLQEVFIKVLRQGARLQAVAQPRAWLFEVTRNTLIDRLRSGHDLQPLPDDLDQWPAEPAEATPTVDTLAQAVCRAFCPSWTRRTAKRSSCVICRAWHRPTLRG